MIRLIKQGKYRLIETKADTKILFVDDAEFAWVTAKGIGEILVVSHKEHETDAILSQGTYNYYDVQDEAQLTDVAHLELEVGMDYWQGYLLPTGFPDDVKKRARIIPTKQRITNNEQFTIEARPKKRGKTA